MFLNCRALALVAVIDASVIFEQFVAFRLLVEFSRLIPLRERFAMIARPMRDHQIPPHKRERGNVARLHVVN